MRKCGIHPFDENVFRDCDFAVNNHEMRKNIIEERTNNECHIFDVSNSTQAAATNRSFTPIPTTSHDKASYRTNFSTPKPNVPSLELIVSPEMIKPIPSIDIKPGSENI